MRIVRRWMFCGAVSLPVLCGVAQALPVDSPGMDRFQAATGIETSSEDLDGDGLPQIVEHQLAAAFLPRIFYDREQEACSLPGALDWAAPGRIVYFVLPRGGLYIDIVYTLLYDEDCGENVAGGYPVWHNGDAEPIVVTLFPASSCPLGWGMTALSAGAHAEPTGYMEGHRECHLQNGAASMMVSRRKHGMFVSRDRCNTHLTDGFLKLDHCSYGGLISRGSDEWIAMNGGERNSHLHPGGSLSLLSIDWAVERMWEGRLFCGGQICTIRPFPPSSPPPVEDKIDEHVGGPIWLTPNSAGDVIQHVGALGGTPQGTATWQAVIGAEWYDVALYRAEENESGPIWVPVAQDRVGQPHWSVPANLGCAQEPCAGPVAGYYKIQAWAANNYGTSPISTVDTFSFFPSCDGPPTAAPTQVGPQGTTVSDPTLRWNPAPCADEFDVEVYGPASPEPLVEARVAAPELPLGSLECDVEHTWRVRGVNSLGSGEWSGSLSFTPSCAELPPNAPADLVATAVPEGHDLVDLHWTDRSQNERGFVVRRRKGGSMSWDPIADLEPDTTSFRDQVPEIGEGTQYYYYKVWAYNAGGDNISEIAEVKLYQNRPVPSDTLRPRGCIDTLTPTLSWRAGENSSQFYVRLVDLRRDQLAMPDVTTTSNSVAVPFPLEADGAYMLRVWGINNEGWGPGSSPEFFSPLCSALGTPTIAQPSPGCVDDPTPEISWTPIAGAISYQTYLWRVVDAGQGDGNPIWEHNGPETSLVLPPLAAGTEYRFKVKAQAGQEGPYSALRFFVVGCEALHRPGTPAPIGPGGATPSTLPTYTWEPAALADTYTLEVWESPTGSRIFSESWSASAICDAAVCSVRPAHPISPGVRYWRVQAHNGNLPAPAIPDGLWGPWGRVDVPSLNATVSVAGLSVSENQGPARFRVRLENPPPTTVEVSYATQDGTALAGTDYQSTSGRLAFAPGQEEAVVEVPVVNDPLYEGGSESFTMVLSNPAGAVLGNVAAPAFVLDDEPRPTLTWTNTTVPEAQISDPARLLFSLSGPSASPIVVPYTVAACTATAGSDYFVQPDHPPLAFAPGTTQATLEVAVLDDGIVEGNEVARIDLGSSSGALLQQGWAELRIRDDDPSLVKGKRPAPKADFDRDRRGDMIWRRDGSGQLAVWTMDGNQRLGGFLVQSAGSPDQGWQVVASADFDGDGDADVVWRNRISGMLVLWSVEAGVVVSGVPLAGMPDLRWQVVGSGDLDRDGRPDLLWWHEEEGTLRAWLMNGWSLREERAFDPAAAADPAWRPAALADFDNDGRTDLLWRHRTSGALSVWFLEGTTRRSGSLLGSGMAPGLEWSVVGAWDVDDDGPADVVFQNVDSKRLLVWYVSGSVVRCVAGFTPGAPADTQWTLVGPR